MARCSFCVIFVGIISTLCGIGMCAVSSWILHKTLQILKNANFDQAMHILHQLESYSGMKTGLHNNFKPISHILISTSATALAGGAIQFISSFCLLLCGVSGNVNLRKTLALIWISLEILVLFSVGGAVLCILTNELKMDSSLRIFIISAGVDVLVIIINCTILAATQREESSPPRQKGFGNQYVAVIGGTNKGGGGEIGGKPKASAPQAPHVPAGALEMRDLSKSPINIPSSNGPTTTNNTNESSNPNLSVQDRISKFETKRSNSSNTPAAAVLGVPVLPMTGRLRQSSYV